MTAFLVLVASFALLLAIGVPVSFGIGLATAVAMLLTIPAGPAVTTVAQRIATGLDSFALQAIPFFLLAGHLMNRGGSAARLIAFARALLGHLPGGLAYVNILAAMLFAAISGSAVATASAVGGVMGPHMERDGYDRGFSAAINISARCGVRPADLRAARYPARLSNMTKALRVVILCTTSNDEVASSGSNTQILDTVQPSIVAV